ITLAPSTWSSSGILRVANGGTLALQGAGTTTGTLDGSGAGSSFLLSGSLVGGTVTETNGAILVGVGGTLDGVTVNGNIQVVSNNGLNVKDGLTLNGTATLGDGSGFGYLAFQNTQTLGGNGSIVFGSTSEYNVLWVPGRSTTLSIGPGITVHG